MEFKKPIYPIEQWNITETEFKKENNYRNETTFALSNGYIGTRGTFEEAYPFDVDTGLEGNFVNGFYESNEIRYGEANFGSPLLSQSLLNLPNLKEIHVILDGEEFTMEQGEVKEYARTLHMKDGILERKLTWTASSGKMTEIHIFRLVSFARKNIMAETSNKQLNFLQIIYNALNTRGNARAAVVVPDNVLFADGAGEQIRCDLMNKCNLHTILRLPSGIFYAQGVQTNVLFFNRGTTDQDNTREVWIYDMRHKMRTFGKRNPLNEKDFTEFEKLYCRDDRTKRKEPYNAENNPDGRWRKFTREELESRTNLSLDISWITEEETDTRTIPELLAAMQEKSEEIARAVDVLTKELAEVESHD